ncbi:MAG: S-ribosylhomocysteine lyase [Bacteroidaceae bacterium]|nr:S-ribosylhomocysteine lyase [Bacteroidaceae bacterium]
MDKIPSFMIDHTRLLRGIYVSRKDLVGTEVVTTLDIRMKEPNREPALGIGALHTIEHLAATYLRNDKEWGGRIVYFGPMGCLTGCYLLVKGDIESRDVLDLVKRTFQFVADFQDEVPGASARDCGNYLLHDLPMARWEAARFADQLEHATASNLNYPE